jgi:hypothetical protein
MRERLPFCLKERTCFRTVPCYHGGGGTVTQRPSQPPKISDARQSAVSDRERDRSRHPCRVTAGEDPGNCGSLDRIRANEGPHRPLIEGAAKLCGNRARDAGLRQGEQALENENATIAHDKGCAIELAAEALLPPTRSKADRCLIFRHIVEELDATCIRKHG